MAREDNVADDRPNIVFLLNDHQAFYRHGWDSGPQISRLHFDRLASEGVTFDRAYTVCPLCGPARRTMLTGVYPHRHGQLNNKPEVPYEHELYLDRLAEVGYRNFYYGKWHAGPGTAYNHQCEGFSYPHYGNPYVTSEYQDYLERKGLPEARFRIERQFLPRAWNDHFPEGQVHPPEESWFGGKVTGLLETPKESHEAFFLADLACQKLRELASSQAGGPFSLRVDFWGPHHPHFPTREFAALYEAREIPEYGSFQDDLRGKPDLWRWEYSDLISEDRELVIPNPLPWREWQKVLARCYAHITMIDAAGGQILDALEETGLAENTLVVWTTDHGDAIACHGGHFGKGWYMPEEMVRIPMALRFPGRILAGQAFDQLVSNADLAPTLLEAAGTTLRHEVDGRSLLPLCSGETGDWREDLMCETHGFVEPHLGRLLVTDRYKYVFNKGAEDELYDLEGDPYELVNLVDDAEHREVLSDMKARLSEWMRRTDDTASLPSEYVAFLRSLGQGSE